MKRKLIIVIMFLPGVIYATKTDTLKYEMIKESITFIASDSKVSKMRETTPDCDEIDYDCLVTFCKTNNINKGADKINAWRAVKVEKQEDLEALKDRLLKEVAGETEKGYRKKLTGYQGYTSKLDELAAEPIESPALPAVKKQADTPTHKSSQDTVLVGTKSTPKTTSEAGGNDLLIYASLLLSVVAIIFAILLWTDNKKRRRALDRFISDMMTETGNLRDALGQRLSYQDKRELTSMIQQVDNKVSSIKNMTQGATNQGGERRTQSNTIELDVNTTPTSNTKTVNETRSGQKKFAKYPDFNNGFNPANLFDSQNGEFIYEIAINDDDASYSISLDPGAQRYALTDIDYYLSKACALLNQPTNNCNIYTVQQGKLKKTSGNWVIQSKAQIEFR